MQLTKSFYSVQEFSEIFCVHPHTIRAAIKAGRLNALRIGRSPRSAFKIPHSEIDRIMEISFEENFKNLNGKENE